MGIQPRRKHGYKLQPRSDTQRFVHSSGTLYFRGTVLLLHFPFNHFFEAALTQVPTGLTTLDSPVCCMSTSHRANTSLSPAGHRGRAEIFENLERELCSRRYALFVDALPVRWKSSDQWLLLVILSCIEEFSFILRKTGRDRTS